MIRKTDYCLVIGAGSIGERYIRNLWVLGFTNIAVLRVRNLPFRDIGDALVTVITSWKETEALRPVVAFICNPTSMHLSSAMECVNRGIHVLIEKPLSHTSAGLDELAHIAFEKKVFVQIGYMMRYHPFMKKIYQMGSFGQLGKLIAIKSHWGEYLPDWHVWEDYRQSYAARRDMGGGAALTLSHDLDLANWLAGAPLIDYKRLYNFSSGLEVDVESGADFLLHYSNGVTANVHLNFFQKLKERWYCYIFENAVVKIDFFRNEMVIHKQDGETTDWLEGFNRNDLFIAQLKDFFKALDNPEKSIANIAESKQIINLCAVNE